MKRFVCLFVVPICGSQAATQAALQSGRPEGVERGEHAGEGTRKKETRKELAGGPLAASASAAAVLAGVGMPTLEAVEQPLGALKTTLPAVCQQRQNIG